MDVGLSTITRTLASRASKDAQPTQQDAEPAQHPPSQHPPYAAIFLLRAGHESTFHAHFLQMVAVASSSSSSATPIRLVGFSSQRASDRLAEALGLGVSARVSAVAVREGAPLAGPLLEIVRARVGPVDPRWLGAAASGGGEGRAAGAYRPLVVEAVQTKVGVPRKGEKVDGRGW